MRTDADRVVLAPEAGPEDEALEPVEVVEHVLRPVERGDPPPHDLDRRVGIDTGARQPHDAGAGAHCAARGQVRGAGHPRPAGDDAHGSRPLVGRRRSGAPPRGDVVGLDEVGAGARRVEADVGDLDLPGERPPSAEQQARLQGGERDRPVGAQHAGYRLTRPPSTPLGMSTASTGVAPTRGARHSPVNPVP